MNKQNLKAVFQKLNIKNIQKEITTRKAVKRAKQISQDMADKKNKSREAFMMKLLENAKLFNAAYDDFVKKDEELYFDEDGHPLENKSNFNE